MRFLLILAASIAATPALAHPGHEPIGFAAGFLHPLGGWDHVAAMVAVGACAAIIGGAARWWLPGAFLLGMLAGGVLGMLGVGLPLVEAGILASILVLGLALASWARVPARMAVPIVALFGLFHGHAHGTEMAGGDAAGYALGFLIATALLHGAGLLLGREVSRMARLELPLRLAGGALAVVAGTHLLLG